MRKSPTWFVLVAILVVALAGGGCTQTSLDELLYVPVANSLIDAGIAAMMGLVDEKIGEIAGDNGVYQAIGEGVSTTVGDLVEYAVDQTIRDNLPDIGD